MRGLLFAAYAFSRFGQIMLWGAMAAFGLAGIMLLLVSLGFLHARRTVAEKWVLVPNQTPVPTA